MLACVDVQYFEAGHAFAAAAAFEDWSSEKPAAASCVEIEGPLAPYRPGELYRRELPCILAALQGAPSPLSTVVVDGYVYLDAAERPGLGAHLYEALGRRVAVVGVAKTPFFGAALGLPVLRGTSKSPLFVSAVGIDVHAAAMAVRSMDGPARIPTLLRYVDRLARAGAPRPWQLPG